MTAQVKAGGTGVDMAETRAPHHARAVAGWRGEGRRRRQRAIADIVINATKAPSGIFHSLLYNAMYHRYNKRTGYSFMTGSMPSVFLIFRRKLSSVSTDYPIELLRTRCFARWRCYASCPAKTLLPLRSTSHNKQHRYITNDR